MALSESNQLVMGLPSTGKTTFIAALWYVVRCSKVPGALSLEKLEGDREYLNRIQEQWLKCNQIGRTRSGSPQRIRIKLRDPSRDTTAVLHLPDMSGETFSEQYQERVWTMEFSELAEDANGVLLFVHPDKIEEPKTIMEMDEFLDLLDESENGDDSEDISTPEADGTPWATEKASTQSKLVDLMQFLESQCHVLGPMRLAVIVSAWDIVERTSSAEEHSPDVWLARRLPLLDQYLKANHELYLTRVYGVSAQGGDLKQDREQLVGESEPAFRIKVCHQDQASHDITDPIKWVMQ